MTDGLVELRDRLNHDHDDTVALVVRHLSGTEVHDARIASIDAGSIEFLGRGPRGAVEVRLQFEAPCTSAEEVREEFHRALVAARTWVGDGLALTSLEVRLARASDIGTFVTEVVAVHDLTPSLRQVTFGGGLDHFPSLGGDQFVYVLLPPPGSTNLTIDESFTWAGVLRMPEAERPVGAYYTVRRWRAEVGEIDAWFVLHGDEGAGSGWAATVEVGAPAALWGPRTAYDPPSETDSYLLVVDETGYGAAAAIVDELARRDEPPLVTVVAECAEVPDAEVFASSATTYVRWVARGDAAPGTSALLLDAVRDTVLGSGVYAFGAAESRLITRVRKHLREERGLRREQVSMTGYWRRT